MGVELSPADIARLLRIADEAEISALIAAYADVMDWLDWDRLGSVFWPEAQFDFGMFKGDYAAYAGFVKTLEEGYRRRLHMFAIPVIRVNGDSARADSGSFIICRKDDGAHGVDDIFCGRYLFTAERRNGEWRLNGLTYVLHFLEQRPVPADDRCGPMHFGDDLNPGHPFAVG